MNSDALLEQLFVAMVASLGYLTVGLSKGFTSPAVPSMRMTSPHLVFSQQAVSWICATAPLGAVLGSLLAGPMLQRLGRKTTLLVSAPLQCFSWLTIALADSLGTMLMGRALAGIAGGITIPSAQIYVSECSNAKIRGVLGSMPAVFMATGVLVSYLLGSLLPWHQLAFASAIAPAILTIIMLLLPESPVWLRINNREKDANHALAWLGQCLGPNPERSQTKDTFTFKAILSRPVLVSFSLVLLILVFQMLSGVDAIIFYTVSIFQSSNSVWDGNEATILVGFVQVVTVFISLFLIDCIGRKPMLIASGVIMALAMAALGIYFYFLSANSADDLTLLPVISLVVFMAGYSIGYCTVPFLLMGELLPTAQRSFLSSFASTINLASMFVVIKTFPDLQQLLGHAGIYWTYATCSALGCIFVVTFLPETKGKSLDEIEQYFEGKQKDAEPGSQQM